MRQKKNNVSYILLLGVLIIIMLAAVVIAQTIKDMINKEPVINNSPTPVTTESPVTTPTNQITPTGTVTPTGTPEPTATATPGLPIIDKIDESKLVGLDNTVRTWFFESPPQSLIDMVERWNGIYKKNTDKKVIYLTVDEGYELGYTSKMLDTLKEKNVKAIFFITGSYIRNNPDLVKRMVEEGHLVGNHTNNHPSMPKKTIKDFINELVVVEKEYEKLIGSGKRMYFYRPPAGAYSERDLNIANQMGYKTVFWSFAYRDWLVDEQKGSDFAHDSVIKGLHNGMVLLLHAVSKDNADALGSIIDSAREKGYEFRRIDE